MHLFLRKIILALLVFVFFNTYSQSVAVYDITFTSVWNTNDHGILPSGAHWSKLIGANHANENEFWQINMQASIGIKDVAERGNNIALQEEIETSINTNNAEQLLLMSSVNMATGSVTFNDVEISKNYSLLTLVSMIAPSPDWFIGINSFNLRENNEWLNNATIDLFVYDAGTDSGIDYSSDNMKTTPQENISSLINIAPFGQEKIGYFTITLKSVLANDAFSLNNEMKIYPNPSKNNVTFSNLQENSISKIEIFNLTGKLLKEMPIQNQEKITTNLSSFESGIYLIKTISVSDENNKITKLVVNN